MSSPPRYPQPGMVVAEKYVVESVIGEGGMGAVLKAKHLDLDELVAIKCLLPEMMSRPEIVRRFIREAKAAVKLKGEHVARVIDVGRLSNDVPFIVMEFLDGADLNAIVKHHGAQDPLMTVDLMLQACEAIAEAHSIGIIHRDIKASNFFITQPENQAPHLKVLDFGIATSPEGTSDLTSTQSVIGTPSYMAPEQMRSAQQADARSDIWSMGVVLYELLEGKRPFRSDAYSDLCLKVGMDPPEPMVNPDVPDGLRTIVRKCLEKPIELRYQSVAELAFDLMPYASDPVAARAAVEQCARLIGRRGSRPWDRVSDPDLLPPRLTPRTQLALDPTPAQTPHSYPRASTPMPTIPWTPSPNPMPKTPTSIDQGIGQVAPTAPPPRRHGLAFGIGAIALIAIGTAGGYVYTQQGDDKPARQPASQPAIAPAPVAAPAPAPAPKPAPPPEVAKPEPPAVDEPKPEVAQPPPAIAVKPKPKPAVVVHPKPKVQTTIKVEPKPDPDDIYTKRQ
jgi:serine/threonine protein kinase